MRFRVCLLLLIAACAGGESTDGKGGPDDSADGGGEGEADGESDGAAPSTLTDLRADAGTLEPTFSPEVTAYTLTLPLQRSSVGLTVTVSAGTPTLDGEPMTAGEAGATATLTIPLDGRSLLLDNAGLESPVTITVARGGSPSTLASASAAGEELGAALSGPLVRRWPSLETGWPSALPWPAPAMARSTSTSTAAAPGPWPPR